MKARFVNPFTDFGFKKLFGEEASKQLLIDFLNSLLPEKNDIVDLVFKNGEHLGQTQADRKAIYDIYCETKAGEKFIVELQKAKQNYFKDRTIYYSTFPIQEQAEKGEWNYKLKAVYCIGLLDFRFDDYDTELEKSEVIHIVELKNQHNRTFYDKLKYVYLEMPNFKKKENELVTRLDKWLFFISNLEDIQQIPAIFKEEKIFEAAFEKAELAKLSKVERQNYENSLKSYRDLKGVIDTAFDEGKIEGKMEEKYEVLAKGLSLGLSVADLARLTGLSEEQVVGYVNQQKA
ncbi:MAG: Rpn family recombination-promoting nuclease/putative transposase, partial [Spirosomataceae bacterium]